jgi:hypothetical protein
LQRNKKARDQHSKPALMSLNNLTLTSQQLVALYENVLTEPIAKDIPGKNNFPYLGGNLNHILIVVNKEASAFLSDAEFDFLTNILTACKLTIADVAIINKATTPNAYQQIVSELNSKQVLLFDLNPLQFGLPLFFPHFQIQAFNNCTFLSAPSLHTLEIDVVEKKKFWSALKTLFAL